VPLGHQAGAGGQGPGREGGRRGVGAARSRAPNFGTSDLGGWGTAAREICAIAGAAGKRLAYREMLGESRGRTA